MTRKNTSWGAVAEWYDDLIESDSDSYQNQVLLPNILRIVDPKPGMRVLDIACGQGFFSRALAEKGAEVAGCDISVELVALAAKNSPKNVSFHAAAADDLKVKAGSFDAALVVMALQNIENLTGAVSQAALALRPGGRFVIVINHPAFRVPQNSSWQWDDERNVQYRRIDSYMSDRTLKIDMAPGRRYPAQKRFTVSFHRPLQSYFKALAKAGLAVTRLEEWISHKKSQPGPRASEEDRARKEFPLFMMMESQKGSL